MPTSRQTGQAILPKPMHLTRAQPRTPWAFGLLVPLLAASTPGCVRYREDSRVAVETLEKPRPAVVARPARLAMEGKRQGNTVLVSVYDQQRCADVFYQKARATRIRVRAPVQSSLVAAYLTGGALTLLGGVGLGWAATHPPPPDSVMATQSVYPSLAAVTAGGLLVLGLAVAEQLRAGQFREDLGERQLEKLVRERPCGEAGGRTPRPGEAVRLTLSDGLQVEGVTDAQGLAVLQLPADLEERLDGQPRRAVLEARSDARVQVVLPL